MRLHCPNCGTGYDVPDGMIPADGRHVQCTDCHTRWFVRGVARPVLTEEQIIGRLEARARSRPVAVPDPPAADAEDPAADFVWEGAEAAANPVPVEAPPSRPANPAPAAPPAPAPSRPAPKPAPKPVPKPKPVAAPAATDATGPPPPLARPKPRIDLTADGAEAPAAAARPGLYAYGLALALGIFFLALVAYRAHDTIITRLPAAAPALGAYVSAVDALREGLAATLRGG